MGFTVQKYRQNLIGGLIYMIGDTIAALIASGFDPVRAVCVFLFGAIVYASEIQRYFKWIETSFIVRFEGNTKIAVKTMMALVYFNPLWIARHLAFVYLVSGKVLEISPVLLKTAFFSFLVNIPVSIIANYLIQNKVNLTYRFWASALFSGLMAVYYSMSSRWF